MAVLYGTQSHQLMTNGVKTAACDASCCDCLLFDNLLAEWIINTGVPLQEVKFVRKEETVDVTVDNQSHTYWTHGCNVSNCSEQYLSRDSLCVLSSINNGKFSAEEEEYEKELFIIGSKHS